MRIPASSTGCIVGRSATKSLALATWSVPRRNVARTTFRSTSSFVRASRRNPSTRPHSPTKGGRGSCACIPTSFSIARSGVTSSRASSICRASVARLSWRTVSVSAAFIDVAGRYFFGKPTDCAKTTSWLSRSFSALASAGRSTEARTPVARPSEAQNR